MRLRVRRVSESLRNPWVILSRSKPAVCEPPETLGRDAPRLAEPPRGCAVAVRVIGGLVDSFVIEGRAWWACRPALVWPGRTPRPLVRYATLTGDRGGPVCRGVPKPSTRRGGGACACEIAGKWPGRPPGKERRRGRADRRAGRPGESRSGMLGGGAGGRYWSSGGATRLGFCTGVQTPWEWRGGSEERGREDSGKGPKKFHEPGGGPKWRLRHAPVLPPGRRGGPLGASSPKNQLAWQGAVVKVVTARGTGGPPPTGSPRSLANDA